MTFWPKRSFGRYPTQAIRGCGFGAAFLVFALGWVGAPRVASSQEYHAFQVDDFGGYLEMGVEGRREKRTFTRGNSSSFDTDSLAFEELLHLDIDGSVLHRKFLHFRGNSHLRLHQETTKQAGEKDNDSRFLRGGNLDLRFLEEHPYHLELTGGIEDDVIDPKFGSSYELRNEHWGVAAAYEKGLLPVYVVYRESMRKGSGGRSDIDETRDDFIVHAAYDLKQRMLGDLKYTETHEVQSLVTNLGDEYTIDVRDFEATNVTYLDREHRGTFRGRVELEDRTDRIETKRGRFFGNLDLRHTDTLSTHYVVDLQRRDVGVDRIDTLNANVRLRHQFWLSLTTQPRLWVNIEDAPFGSTKRYGAQLHEEYSKKLGDWGRFSLSLAPSVELESRRPTASTGFVIDESVLLVNLTPVALREVDIDPTTIHVTDAMGVTIYQENIDYRVTVRGRVTELTRIAGGNIGDPESVLVDYEFKTGGDNDILNKVISTHGSITFRDWVKVYAGYVNREQELRKGVPETELQSNRRWVTGANARLDWVSVEVEFEDEDGTFSSSTSLSETLAFFLRQSSSAFGRCSISHRGVSYRNSDEKVDRWIFTALYRQRFGPRGWLEVEGDYQRERWDKSGGTPGSDIDAFGSTASYKWSFRHFELELGSRYSWLDQRDQEENSYRLFARIRRYF